MYKSTNNNKVLSQPNVRFACSNSWACQSKRFVHDIMILLVCKSMYFSNAMWYCCLFLHLLHECWRSITGGCLLYPSPIFLNQKISPFFLVCCGLWSVAKKFLLDMAEITDYSRFHTNSFAPKRRRSMTINT